MAKKREGDGMLANDQKLKPIAPYVIGEIVGYVDERLPPSHMQIVADSKAAWHVVTVWPGQERLTAAHLIARGHKLTATDHLVKIGVGVYIPESDVVEIKRGRQVERHDLILPGYVLIFVWGVEQQYGRIVGCPGVMGMLMAGNSVAVVPDHVMDDLRAAENRERFPLTVTVEDVVGRGRKRQSRKREVSVDQLEIASVHSYSPKLEEERQARVATARQAFAKAMGLPEAAS